MSCHLYFIHTQSHTARCKYGMPSSYNANKSTTSLYRVILWELGARICRVRCRRWEHETLKSKSFTNGIRRQYCTCESRLERGWIFKTISLTETACRLLCPNASPRCAHPTNDQLGRHSTCK